MEVHYQKAHWLSSRAIICPTNSAVDEINEHVMNIFPGNAKEYLSSDTILENEHQYPIEYINQLCPSGMPPHKLKTNRNSLISLLLNLDPVNGHCNGTIYFVENMHDHVMDATVATGPNAGKHFFIPRIPLCPSKNLFPFTMRRKQFPVRPAFAITANKAQGQTLKTFGIHLPVPFFSHGQLYVAMSRVGSRDGVKICLTKSVDNKGVFTDNVVYPVILRQ